MIDSKRFLLNISAVFLLLFGLSGTAHAGLNDGLAGYWTFDEGVGVIANDVSGNGNTGTINGATFVPGHANTALAFNGIDQNVVIPDSPSLDPASSITLSVWVQVNGSNGDILSKDGEVAERQYMINYVNGHFRAHVGTTTGFFYFDSAHVYSSGWHHVAMTYDGATLKLFVDGALDGSLAVTGTIVPTTQPVRIGGGAPTGTAQLFFAGTIDEVKIYNRALADCEVGRLAGGTGQCLVPAVQSAASPSKQYLQIDPELQQDIVVDNQQSPGNGALGEAWLPNGHMLRRNGPWIIEYSLDQTRIINTTPVYDIVATHYVGVPNGGGMTNGTDGYIYANASNGVYRIDPVTWTSVRVTNYGYYYGIGTLPDGRIVDEMYNGYYLGVYNPNGGGWSYRYLGYFVDDLTTTSDGYILLALRYNQGVMILDSNLNTVRIVHVGGASGGAQPDGMAFGNGSLYTANTDGSISRIDFSGPNFTGTATETIVASQGFYGDLSSVGPDGAFYITTNGERYDNGVTASGWGVVRISKVGGFDTPPGVPANKPPVANAGAAQTVECTGNSSADVTLDGSGSTDPDSGDTLTYAWSWSGGSATGVKPTASFPLGTTDVTLTVDDGHGHTDTATTTVTVQDTTPPTVSAGPSVTLEATSTSGAAYDVAAQASVTDNCCAATPSIAPAGPYPLGSTTVTVTGTDCSNNTASATMVVTVRDTIPPAITAPANVTVEANAVNSTVSIGTATATDIFPVTITSNAPATYPLGTTVVTWKATDANGNSSTATQTVTVQDTTPPVLTVPANVTAEANGNPTSTVAIGSATATDIFGVTITSDAPAAYPLGTTVVTWTATDANGNSSTGTQTVTVQDTTPPVLTVPANVKVEATGPQTSVSIGTATGTDLFGPVSITSNAPATYPLGTTTVTWTATDANGNSSTGTQTVTVVDTTPPTVTAQLVPIPTGHGESDEHRDSGLFQVVFSATDLVDPNPTLTATLNGATVTNGQIVKLERGRHAEIETEHGRLEIKAMSFTLNVTATDASGNVGTGSASYAFPVHHDEDNGIHRGNDKADHHVDSGKHKSEGKAKIVHKKAGKPAKKASKSKKGNKRG